MTTTRHHTLSDRVVDDLVHAGIVEPGRAVEATALVSRRLGDTGPAVAGTARGRMVEIAGYAGGALVLAAAALFTADQWDRMSDALRVGSVVLLALVLGAAGLAVTRAGTGRSTLATGAEEARRRLASALLVGGAVAAGVAVALAIILQREEDSEGWPAVLGAGTALVLLLAGYRVVGSALGHVAAAFAALMAVMSLAGQLSQDTSTTDWAGLSLMALGVVWVLLVEREVLAEPVVGRLAGSGFALLGAQMMLFDGQARPVAYAATALVALAGFGLYVRLVSWPYLVAGVLGVTLVVPEAILDWTDGLLGPAGAVLVTGLTLLAASLAGLRVRREAIEGRPSEPAGR